MPTCHHPKRHWVPALPLGPQRLSTSPAPRLVMVWNHSSGLNGLRASCLRWGAATWAPGPSPAQPLLWAPLVCLCPLTAQKQSDQWAPGGGGGQFLAQG